MTSNLDFDGRSAARLRCRRSFRVRMWFGSGCYLLASLALSLSGGPWRLVSAALSLLIMVWLVVNTALRARQLDEYQVKLLFPGLAVGFILAMMAALTLGTLSQAGISVPNAGWPVCIIGVLAWQITNLAVGAPRR
ncbi:hypothetical protein [Leekyejoonella antrihumi]|uniref:Uncharacterized protein n=1 Tax=Leekyejoonella antrihumi TaxID=1660198 RepID=A0A563DYX1_9MICO|nr:hypothetical protein [Leekyejoonella antrihumi]TWP35319.1 hypothetical protein FGL98_14505 [Leekyejoonella antrihumi]